ncbi:hypothetical protein D3C84_1040270 [compost metagenome]
MLLHHSIHFVRDSLIFTGIRQAQYSLLRQVEAVHLIQYTHIEWCGNIAVLTVPVHMQVMVVAVEEQILDQPFIAMECENDRFILCEKLIKLIVR